MADKYESELRESESGTDVMDVVVKDRRLPGPECRAVR